MDKTKIDRINELAHLSKSRALTDEEKEEQRALRCEYIEAIKKNFRNTLDSIEIK